ncbi:MAG: HD-GYP domain-containing protein [Candidatus Omnitrophica bacterium]|nr:HD-GYP domain-containing protein [Candidatus Omnitrophota bacterium]
MTIFPLSNLLILLGITAGGVAFFLLKKVLAERERNLDQIKDQTLEWNRRLEAEVSKRTRDLESTHRNLEAAYLETVTALVEAMTAKDNYLGDHSHNVSHYAGVIAEEMGLAGERIERLKMGCELHDLGKIAIPDSILLKPGPLTPEEFEVIKQHPVWGARILEPLTFMRDITEMVNQEHERWDGKGYPRGLRGDRIRLEARIIAVADAIDAMTSHRPYRKSVSLDEVAAELKRNAGSQFDPQATEAAVSAIEKGILTVRSNTNH